ncbi:hypothetical protein KW786_01870 [Candidatus Parcubacteria bacterium]|nr:hypothetical protein [Candidatus Parcubacteria bacterium]
MEGYKNQNIIVLWFQWHFYQMPALLFSMWKNYLEFSMDFFSAPLLLMTLFSPWRKYHWHYPRAFDIKEYLNTFVSNFFSRILGAICRSFLIVASIVPLVFVFLAGAAVIIGWFLLPLMLIMLAWVFINL